MSISSLLSAVATELESRQNPPSISPPSSPQSPSVTRNSVYRSLSSSTTTTTTRSTSSTTTTTTTGDSITTAALSSSSSSSLFMPSQAMEGSDFTNEVVDSSAEMSEDNEDNEDEEMGDSDSSGDSSHKALNLNGLPNRLVNASRRLSMSSSSLSNSQSSSSKSTPKPRLGNRPKSNSFKDLSPSLLPSATDDLLGLTHQCAVVGCTATFQSQEHLKRHMRKHTGEKPFACLFPGCPKTFSRNDNMLQHLRTHAKVVKGKMAKGPTGKLVPSSIALAIRETMLGNNSSPPSPSNTHITPLNSAAVTAARRLSRTSSSNSLRSRSRSRSQSPKPPPAAGLGLPPSLPCSSAEKALAVHPQPPPQQLQQPSSPPHMVSLCAPPQGPISPPLLPSVSSIESMLLGTHFQSKEPSSFRHMIPYNELANFSETARRNSVSNADRAALDKLKGPQ